MTDFKRIEFKTFDGTVLRGNFFQSEGDRTPVIVMTQGLTLLKEHYIDDTACRFQAASGNIVISDDVKVGAGSVVVHSVPEGSTVVGSPGRVVRGRATSLGQLEHARVAEAGESELGEIEHLNDKVRELEALMRLLLEERVGDGRG